jgi:hypothetical protein
MKELAQYIEMAIAAASSRDFSEFDVAVAGLQALGWVDSQVAVEERFVGVLVRALGETPTYDTIIKLSRVIGRELQPHLKITPHLVEFTIRRFYGEPEIVGDLPSNVVQVFELAIAGVLLGPSPK